MEGRCVQGPTSANWKVVVQRRGCHQCPAHVKAYDEQQVAIVTDCTGARGSAVDWVKGLVGIPAKWENSNFELDD